MSFSRRQDFRCSSILIDVVGQSRFKEFQRRAFLVKVPYGKRRQSLSGTEEGSQQSCYRSDGNKGIVPLCRLVHDERRAKEWPLYLIGR